MTKARMIRLGKREEEISNFWDTIVAVAIGVAGVMAILISFYIIFSF